jgi:hypothetical protein
MSDRVCLTGTGSGRSAVPFGSCGSSRSGSAFPTSGPCGDAGPALHVRPARGHPAAGNSPASASRESPTTTRNPPLVSCAPQAPSSAPQARFSARRRCQAGATECDSSMSPRPFTPPPSPSPEPSATTSPEARHRSQDTLGLSKPGMAHGGFSGFAGAAGIPGAVC